MRGFSLLSSEGLVLMGIPTIPIAVVGTHFHVGFWGEFF